jgi:hypothetical protein
MKRILSIVLPFVLLSAIAFPQSNGSNPLIGVWKVTEIDGVTTQPGLVVFTKSHYSLIPLEGAKPQVRLPDGGGSDVQKAQLFDMLAANAGRYDISGSKLIRHPLVAKSPNVRTGFSNFDFRISGNTLTLSGINLLGHQMMYRMVKVE